MKEEVQQSDEELLESFVHGNADAMDSLVLRYRDALFHWFLGMTGSHADAEDLFQECWIRIIRAADRFTAISFKAWMWRIAKNLLTDYRRRQRDDLSLDAPVATGDDGTEVLLGERIASSESAPSDRLETTDLYAKVMDAVRRLPEKQREVFLLRTEADLSFKEIAEQLGVPLNTALGRMHDAMEKLKSWLAEGSAEGGRK